MRSKTHQGNSSPTSTPLRNRCLSARKRAAGRPLGGRNGARPEYDITHSYCGSRSLHMRDRGTPWGGNRVETLARTLKGQTGEATTVASSLAVHSSKIPDGVQPVLLIHIRYVGWRSRVFDSKADFILNPGNGNLNDPHVAADVPRDEMALPCLDLGGTRLGAWDMAHQIVIMLWHTGYWRDGTWRILDRRVFPFPLNHALSTEPVICMPPQCRGSQR